jgi:hypothetical protein
MLVNLAVTDLPSYACRRLAPGDLPVTNIAARATNKREKLKPQDI